MIYYGQPHAENNTYIWNKVKINLVHITLSSIIMIGGLISKISVGRPALSTVTSRGSSRKACPCHRGHPLKQPSTYICTLSWIEYILSYPIGVAVKANRPNIRGLKFEKKKVWFMLEKYSSTFISIC